MGPCQVCCNRGDCSKVIFLVDGVVHDVYVLLPMAQILNLLLENLIGSDDEDPTPEDVQCRNVVAECLGHLALLQPPLLDQLLAQTQNGNGIMRQYIVRAIKATLVASPHPVDSYLKEMMPFLLSHLEDENRCAHTHVFPHFGCLHLYLTIHPTHSQCPWGRAAHRMPVTDI